MNTTIKIALAEDKVLMRMSLVSLLSQYPMLQVAGQAGNGKELLDLLKRTEVHVVLLDLEMPVMSGIETLKVMHLRFPQVKVIVLSTHNDIWHVKNAMAHGAHGYMSKDCHPEQLVTAITTVKEKDFYLEAPLLNDLVQESIYASRPTAKDTLSSREKEVLRALCEGHTEKEIAQSLNISPHTVHFHRMNLHAKTNSHNLADLLRYANAHRI